MKHEITPQNIEMLVQKAQEGHKKSFEKLFEHFFDKISRYVSFRVNESDREDIVGDVFLKVVKNLEMYSVQQSSGFSSWIFRIAHNTVIDFYRQKKEIVGMGDEEDDFFQFIPDENPRPDEFTNNAIETERLYKMLQKIKPEYREVLELKYLEGFSNKEVAQITGKTEGNIRIIQLRALQSLRKEYE